MPEPIATPQPPEAPPVTPEPPVAAVKTWHDSFSDEGLKTDENIKKYKSLDDFGKAFKEKDSMIGRKGVVLPKENDEADMGRFFNDLGRPETADKYVSPEIQVEDNLKQFVSPEKLEAFKGLAHKYGLTQKQFDGITKEYSETQLNDIKMIIAQEAQSKDDAQKTLMNEWLLDYDGNTKKAELAIESFSKGLDSDTVDALKANPNVKRMFLEVHKVISEDRLSRGTNKPTDTAATLQAFIDSQVKDPEMKSAYHNANAPDHKATREKVKEAYAQLDQLRRERV